LVSKIDEEGRRDEEVHMEVIEEARLADSESLAEGKKTAGETKSRR
jgi:hypothetical protein